MKTYTKKVSEPWFSLIKLGKKKCEGRINKGDFAQMNQGDIIIFTNNELGFNRQFSVTVKYTKKYKTFREYLSNEKLKRCLPGIDNIEDGINIYYKYFTKNDESNFGVCAVRVKIIK